MNVAMRLRVARMNDGKSIRARAAESGVAPHVLRYAEQGGRPRLEHAKLIADFYGTTVTDLWPPDLDPTRAAA